MGRTPHYDGEFYPLLWGLFPTVVGHFPHTCENSGEKADNAPLIISFLFEIFKEAFTNQGEGSIKEKELADRLADTFYVLNDANKVYPSRWSSNNSENHL